MITKEIATIPFTDADSGNEAIAVVRQCGDRLAIAFSVHENGDLEVLLDVDTAKRFTNAITLGIESIASAVP